MSKSIKLGLVLSIAANVILFASLAAGYVSIKKSSGGVVKSVVARGGGSTLSAEAARQTVSLLTRDDMMALRDGLRALGLPEDEVRRIVQRRISSRNAARMREINEAALEAARQRPYWRGRRQEMYSSGIYTPEQEKEMREMRDEGSKESRRLFGREDAYGYAAAQYAFLSPEKAARLQELESDYDDLKWRTHEEMAGFLMPGDEATLKLIDDEKKRDRLALLTPEEREADALRNSEAARKLQGALRGFITTEEEYKAIFALQSALEEKYPLEVHATAYYGGADTAEFRRARNEEQKNIDAQIREMLGEERYADYLRGQREDYQSLMAAAERFDLSAEAVVQTYQVRDDTANEAKRISDDKSLSAAQKREAYAALAEQAIGQIKASLGDDVGDAYINNSLGWLKNLPKGGNVTIGPKGNVTVSQPKAGKGKKAK
jgi:hypothetical protein